MNVSLYQAAAALNASARSQDIIASNMAASAIPGIKKQEMSFSAIQAGMLTASGNSGAPMSINAGGTAAGKK